MLFHKLRPVLAFTVSGNVDSISLRLPEPSSVSTRSGCCLLVLIVVLSPSGA